MEQVLGWDISRVYTSTELADTSGNKNIPVLGQEVTDGRTGKKYRFCKATTAWNAGDVLVRDYAGADEPNSLAPCSAVAQPIAGIANSTVALNGAGWVQTQGEYPTANIAASTAGGMIGTTATAGRGTAITIGAAFNQAELQAVQSATQSIRVTALDVAAGNLCQVTLNQ